LQLDILQINIKQLMQPILDIGCGTKGHLVIYFEHQGLEVYGIDRSNPSWICSPQLLQSP
jgi:2-polyprenyl-3-methyl-5-hydroxy-6-metoxy-1,4-benzoquinol methylase